MQNPSKSLLAILVKIMKILDFQEIQGIPGIDARTLENIGAFTFCVPVPQGTLPTGHLPHGGPE